MTFKDPCTIALELDKELMQIHTSPYVENLVEMGYDRADCETVAVAGVDKTFPMTIHGRVYQTQEEYDEALHDFLNGI